MEEAEIASIGSHTDSDDVTVDFSQEDSWEDVKPDLEDVTVVCLFDDTLFPDVRTMIQHCRETHGWDIATVCRDLGLDFYNAVKLINFIRGTVLAGNPVPATLHKEDFEHEKFLQPVLRDDPLLYNLDEIMGSFRDETTLGSLTEVQHQLNLAEKKIAFMEETVTKLETQLHGQGELLEVAVKGYPRRIKSVGPEKAPREKESLAAGVEDNDYFNSYASLEMHEIMLKDHVRTDAYQKFVYANAHLIKGKTVLDVGCGSGILSLFCAKAGAKMVYAVDNSDIIHDAMQNMWDNGMQSIVTCLKGKVEEITLPVEKVDIIISEWMGFGLLYEAMLESVLYARDRYLAPDGLMIPSYATLRLAPVHCPNHVKDRIEFWDDVYGFSMKSMASRACGVIDTGLLLDADNLASAPATILHLDLHTAKVEDLTFLKELDVRICKDIPSVDAWAMWFDIFFTTNREHTVDAETEPIQWNRSNPTNGVAFTTGPNGSPTHWKQAVMFIDRRRGPGPLPIARSNRIVGQIKVKKPAGCPRGLEVKITWETPGASHKEEQVWKIE